MYSGYRADRWYWELVVVVRKLMVICVANFMYENTLQLHVVILALMFSFATHTVFLPFDVGDLENGGQLLHRLERNSMLVILLLMWSANVFVIGKEQVHRDIKGYQNTSTFLVIMVFLSNLVFMVRIKMVVIFSL